MANRCVDRVVGEILAGWRYDISGLAPEMRHDYDDHFAACAQCRSRRILHRVVDFALILIASFSALLFVAAFLFIRSLRPQHAFIMEAIAAGGFLFSALTWLVVAVTTPVPVVVADAAMLGARKIHEKLPEEIKSRIPEDLAAKITGT
jgi:hypothetical protein